MRLVTLDAGGPRAALLRDGRVYDLGERTLDAILSAGRLDRVGRPTRTASRSRR
jgi:hypothetical protein